MVMNHNNKVTYACNTHVLHDKTQCILKGINKFNMSNNSKIT